jgi:hypothetical protein
MRRIAFLFVASVSLACAGTGAAVGSSNPTSAKVVVLAQDFDLAPGQAAVVDGGALNVTFDKVAEDSRCPSDVQCVWAGDGAVAMTVIPAGAPRYPVTLHTTLTPKAVNSGPYQITLVGLKPYPKQGPKIPPATYVATLQIIRQ